MKAFVSEEEEEEEEEEVLRSSGVWGPLIGENKPDLLLIELYIFFRQ
ncbi:hypothetical protein P0D28_01160 [Mycoplasmoides gallisepticum]|nr:hypothetical protein [Mycoplasmoides gallisepticum]WGG24175.1 hypothetical protein P0D30_01170 [Mycoplasmoides gallisepticum]WGG24932.1 hypothetical protein P0D28_01160 [Mycoplasmoides gallisepticum]